MHLPLFDGVQEGADDVLLSDDVGERAGTVAAVERRAGRHGRTESSGAFGRAAGRVAVLAPTVAEHGGRHREHHDHDGREDRGRRHIGTQRNRDDRNGDQTARHSRAVANKRISFVPHALQTVERGANFAARRCPLAPGGG